MQVIVPVFLQIGGLSKRYGDLTVLREVSLNVARGEVVALIGPSGSGKSTLLRCINRLEEPSSGSIKIDGTEVLDRNTSLTTLRRNVGMVFQSFNLYPHLTALQNITLALRKVVKMEAEKARLRALELLEQVGLANKASNYPSQLSGGQQQRVAIARALALDPKLMLFDEPTSALDPELVGSVLKVIRDLRTRHMTMVIVTHELNFAREVADTVVMMDHGTVVEASSPQELFGNPRNQRTRDFLSHFSDRQTDG